MWAMCVVVSVRRSSSAPNEECGWWSVVSNSPTVERVGRIVLLLEQKGSIYNPIT